MSADRDEPAAGAQRGERGSAARDSHSPLHVHVLFFGAWLPHQRHGHGVIGDYGPGALPLLVNLLLFVRLQPLVGLFRVRGSTRSQSVPPASGQSRPQSPTQLPAGQSPQSSQPFRGFLPASLLTCPQGDHYPHPTEAPLTGQLGVRPSFCPRWPRDTPPDCTITAYGRGCELAALVSV